MSVTTRSSAECTGFCREDDAERAASASTAPTKNMHDLDVHADSSSAAAGSLWPCSGLRTPKPSSPDQATRPS